jgi:signal transduction histidine kinase/CheY-like chemotaxis protein
MTNAGHERTPVLGRHVAQVTHILAPTLRQVPVALVASAAALALRWAEDPWLGDRHEFLPLYLALAPATWFGTWRAGALAAVLFFFSAESLFSAPRSAADAAPLHVVLATLSYWLLSTAVVVAVHLAARDRGRLRRRVRQLDEADHRKSDFIALLAHELRNPLAVLTADTVLIRQGKLDPRKLDDTWQALERQTAHMKRIIGDLLDTARLEQGKLALDRKPVDVAALVAQSVVDAEIFTGAKQQALLLTLGAAPGQVLADPERIRQVLDNLLHNASKFSPVGSEIRIALSASPGEVRISVRDSGIGMEPEDLSTIFGSFVQVAPGAAQTQGLGLGLALCRTLVEMHGGSIEAHSAGKGCGSEFVLRLPRPPELAMRGAAPPQRREPAPSPAAANDAAPPGPISCKVLVVDDNADAADSLAMLLELAGQEPVVAYSGRAALDVARAEQPRIVFLDIRLPDMPAADVAAKLREGSASARPALVAMSGLPQDENTAPPDLASFMIKPFDMAAIVDALAAATRKLEATEPPRA